MGDTEPDIGRSGVENWTLRFLGRGGEESGIASLCEGAGRRALGFADGDEGGEEGGGEVGAVAMIVESWTVGMNGVVRVRRA